MTLPPLATLRQYAHDLLSILGVLTLLLGAVTSALPEFGVTLNLQQAHWLLAAGAAITGASKLLNVLGGMWGVNSTVPAPGPAIPANPNAPGPVA